MPQAADDLMRHALEERADATFDRCRRLSNVASSFADNCGCLAKEDDDGGVEYKWRLTGITLSRFEHLLTQMQFRVNEGGGQCLYELGVVNDGSPKGLPLCDYQESVKTVQRMARALGFDATILHEFRVCEDSKPLWCGEILVTQRQAKQQIGRVAFCGSPGSGKTTLMGVLLKGVLDDGAGTTRQLLFNYKHEINTGRTTSIVTRVLPIENTETGDAGGSLHNLKPRSRTSHSLTLIDLGGGVTKRMLFGLMSWRPDFTGICLSAGQSAKEVIRYASVCRAMRFSFFVLVTKLDTIPDFEVDDFLLELAGELSSIDCDSVFLTDAVGVEKFQQSWKKSSQVPILCASSVNGSGMDVVRHFMSTFPFSKMPLTPDDKFEVFLDRVFLVSGVGPVARGHVARGSVELGRRCCIGPDVAGRFYPVTVKGIHVEGSHVTRVQQDDEATFALSEFPDGLDMSHKGKRLIPSSVDVFWAFEAYVNTLSQVMTPRLQPIVYSGNLRQAVKIIPFDDETFNMGGCMRFQFLYHPEVIREGASIILQWGSENIAVGEVQTVFTHFLAQSD